MVAISEQVYISRELKISKYIPNTSEVSSFLTNLAKSTVFGAGLVLFTKKDHYVKKWPIVRIYIVFTFYSN